MQALLGFHVGFWDYVTFLAIFIIVICFLTAAVFVLGLPGRVAIACKHPEADDVNLMGWKSGARTERDNICRVTRFQNSSSHRRMSRKGSTP
jgi:hypothetical protein